MDLGIAGKIAVVQASSKGLGFGIARELSIEGVNVVICARTKSAVFDAAHRIQEVSGNPVHPVVCDVSQPEQLPGLFRECREIFGDPDILVCNAGGPPRGKFNDFTDADWQAALQTNFLSAVAAVQQVVPAMREKHWGRILFITSIAVKQPIDDLVLSNAARSALTAFAKTITAQLAPDGITVNCLLPGAHRTSRLEQLVNEIVEEEGCTIEEAWDRLGTHTPIGRLGDIEEFGALATFLCSRQAAFITGQSVVHDGGAVKGLY
ncbi:MAG: SDR family oxidoreductase [Candidatus Neomarinimicrobiota bacterium]